MNILMLEEISQAVQRINEDIHKDPNMEEVGVDFICNGEVCVVRFLDMEVWDSQEDDRNFNETDNTYMPLEEHLRLRINIALIHIKRIEL